MFLITNSDINFKEKSKKKKVKRKYYQLLIYRLY
jgi:hypothetical protein